MGFFEDMSDCIETTGEKVGKKAKEIGATAKFQGNITSEELKIRQLYYKLGREYYTTCKDVPDPAVQDMVEEINECNLKIAENRKKIEEEKERAKYQEI